jgi:hypothetical protein
MEVFIKVIIRLLPDINVTNILWIDLIIFSIVFCLALYSTWYLFEKIYMIPPLDRKYTWSVIHILLILMIIYNYAYTITMLYWVVTNPPVFLFFGLMISIVIFYNMYLKKIE